VNDGWFGLSECGNGRCIAAGSFVIFSPPADSQLRSTMKFIWTIFVWLPVFFSALLGFYFSCCHDLITTNISYIKSWDTLNPVHKIH